MIELVEVIKKVSEKDITYKLVAYPNTYPADEPNRRVPSIEKAYSDLNYSPSVSLEEGLERFLKWSDLNYKGEN